MCEISKTCTPGYSYLGNCGSQSYGTGSANNLFMDNSGCSNYLGDMYLQNSQNGYGNSYCSNYQNNMMQNFMNMMMQFMMYMQQMMKQYDYAAGGGCQKKCSGGGCGSDTGSCKKSSCDGSSGYDMNDYWGNSFGTGGCGSSYRYIDKDSDNNLNMDSGLKYSQNSLKNIKDGSVDGTKDNKVSLQEYGTFSDIVDRNGDKYVSPGEDFALKSIIDRNHDGQISKCEMNQARARYVDNKEDFKGAVDSLYYNAENSKGYTIRRKDSGYADLDQAIVQ